MPQIISKIKKTSSRLLTAMFRKTPFNMFINILVLKYGPLLEVTLNPRICILDFGRI